MRTTAETDDLDTFEMPSRTQDDIIEDVLTHKFGFEESSAATEAYKKYRQTIEESERLVAAFHKKVRNVIKQEEASNQRLAGIIIHLLLRGNKPEAITSEACQRRFDNFIFELNSNADISMKNLCREVFQPERDRGRIETGEIFDTKKIFCPVKLQVVLSNSRNCFKRKIVRSNPLPTFEQEVMIKIVSRINLQVYRHKIKGELTALNRQLKTIETQIEQSRQTYLRIRNSEILTFAETH